MDWGLFFFTQCPIWLKAHLSLIHIYDQITYATKSYTYLNHICAYITYILPESYLPSVTYLANHIFSWITHVVKCYPPPRPGLASRRPTSPCAVRLPTLYVSQWRRKTKVSIHIGALDCYNASSDRLRGTRMCCACKSTALCPPSCTLSSLPSIIIWFAATTRDRERVTPAQQRPSCHVATMHQVTDSAGNSM